jgi:hypothetical protein
LLNIWSVERRLQPFVQQRRPPGEPAQGLRYVRTRAHRELRELVPSHGELRGHSQGDVGLPRVQGQPETPGDLSNADLSEANLERCQVEGACLDGAKLGGANLEGMNGRLRSGNGPDPRRREI